MEETKKEIKLKVMEAVQDDVNRGIVKIDSNYLRHIKISPGEVVEITGERKTVAVADRAYPGDIGLNIIRMDGNTRSNSRSTVGEVVTINKIESEIAKEVTIAPTNSKVIVKASPHLLKLGLLGKAVIKGDLVSLGHKRL